METQAPHGLAISLIVTFIAYISKPIPIESAVFFLILSIFFNIGMVFLELITARGTFSGILMPIVAVAPIGPF